jgi:hypothetical protein
VSPVKTWGQQIKISSFQISSYKDTVTSSLENSGHFVLKFELPDFVPKEIILAQKGS